MKLIQHGRKKKKVSKRGPFVTLLQRKREVRLGAYDKATRGLGVPLRCIDP